MTVPGFAGWIGEQRRVYFDNAPMVREYRTQLRGNKAPFILTGYLSLLVFISMIVYWGISWNPNQSISSMQGALTGFFYAVIGMLEFLVAVIAPVVAATSVIGEYERRSIELIFSSPMGAKYFLVGKLVASYRYVLMLIVLALPIAAITVVLGGATWKDVLSSFLMISMHGLLYMAISLPIAVMTAKSVSTVLLGYLINFAWINIIGAFGGMSLRTPGSALPIMGLCPYFSGVMSDATTDIAGIQIPLWLSTVILTLLLVKLLVLGAGSALTQGGTKETLSLRIHGLVYAASFGLVIGVASSGGATVPFGVAGTEVAGAVWFYSALLLICLPYLSTWSLTGGSKVFPNGMFRPKLALRGTPASGLPYLGTILLVFTLGIVLADFPKFLLSDKAALIYFWGVFAAWGLAWSLGWAASAMTVRQGPESSRRLLLLFLFVVVVLPGFVLWIADSVVKLTRFNLRAGWSEDLYLFSFMTDGPVEAAIKVAVLTALGIGIGWFAESKRRKTMETVARSI